MSITTALHWRYATKRMNGTKIPKEKMDTILNAIALAPSSFGLQPYSILIIENKELLEKIKPIAMNQPQITEASAVVVFATWDHLTQDRIDAFIALKCRGKKSKRGKLKTTAKHARKPTQ